MDYKSVIESRYNRQNWQLLLHDIFGNKIKFWNTPSTIPTSSQFAKQALWLGTITLSDNQTISIYEVELSDSVDIERNRRGIRDMLLTDWRNNGNAGAFMFCYRKNESVLRFSYVSEAWTFADDGSYQKESTDAKRFTYLLGEGHRSRTAIQQFEKLRDSSLTLKDLTKAFSVDAVSDMFFDGYKKQYEDIIQYITGKRMVKVANKWEEQIKNDPCEEIMQEFAHFQNPEKAVRDYVKKLMGRLVFLQFLQKKGWLGVPAGAEWGTGDAEFIQTLFAQCQDKDHFVDDVLESLFNDLNSENEKQLPQYRTPYLNGGLFERDATDETEFPLPAKYMQSLLDFFASYNFTIDENDPDDAEVGVDPEMLGRIFENLLEDNKDKGAFYTPKEIVSYMCRESLIAYLQTGIEDEQTKEAIRQFVTTHDAATLGTNDRFRQQVDEALKNVKICDPAIGSGAFPMGLLKELFQCRTALEGIEQSKAAEIKKHIIQQNIYGVDIERGAVDIARLRFWLSLIVDEEMPQALPNLDYKIIEGNSLITTFDNQYVDLSINIGSSRLRASLVKIRPEKRALREEQKRFFSLSGEEKYRSEIAIKNHILNIIWYQLDYEKHSWMDATVEHADLFGLIDKKVRRKNDAQVVEFTSERQVILDKCEKLMNDLNDESKSLQERANIPISFFEWETVFSDVFDNENKKGFDIVIANPPYIGSKGNEEVFHKVQSSSWGRIYFERWMDYFYFFMHKGIDILCDNGVLCYITTNYYYTATGAVKLRTNIKNWNLYKIVDFGEIKLFESALGQHNAITMIKKDKDESKPTSIVKFKASGYRTNVEISQMLRNDNKDVERFSKSKHDVFSGKDNQIVISHIDDTENGGNIIEKIVNHSSPLSTYALITMGIVTLSDVVSNKHVEKYRIEGIKKGDGIYVLDDMELRSLGLKKEDMIYIKPFFKNSDIKKYYTSHKTNKWLIYVKDEGTPINLPQPLKNHFEKFKPIIVALKENFLKNEIAAGVVKKWLKNGNYFVLFTPKKESYFTSEKIIAPYRSKENVFSLSEASFFASKDVAYIIPYEKSYVKLFLGILNSKLALFWLKTMGKMKGDVLELYAKPLNEIPIKIPQNMDVFIDLVNSIIEAKMNDKKTTIMEKELDIHVYHLYDLSYDEVLIVDPKTNITKEEYYNYKS